MGRSNSSGVGTHTDGDGNLITFDENGSEVLLGQDDEPEQSATGDSIAANELEPFESEPDPADTVETKTVDVRLPDPADTSAGQSEETPATGGFLVSGSEQ